MRRVLAAVIGAVMLTTLPVWAQAPTPSGAFVRDYAGDVWLLLGTERHRVPIHPTPPEQLAGLPPSGKWVIPAPDGSVTLGDRPSWDVAATSPITGLDAYVGSWERRDFRIYVNGDGAARARWRKGVCQYPSQPDPCDLFVDGRLLEGGYAELIFTEVVPGTPAKATGYVTIAVPGVFERGAISLVKLSDDLAMLEQPSTSRPLWVCRPPRDLNACGP